MSDTSSPQTMEQLRESVSELSRKLDHERQRRKMVEAILSNIHVVLSANDAQQAFSELIRASQPIIPYDMVGIIQPINSADGDWMCVLSNHETLSDMTWSAGALFRRVLKGQPVASFDVSLIAEWKAPLSRLEHNPIVSVLHMPIEGLGQRAMMVCTSPARAAFGSQHVESAKLLSSLAAQVLINMEHRRSIQARDVATRADRAKSMFLAAMSHELRTPLNIIIGYGELIAEEAEDREVDWFSDDLNKILSSANHLLQLVGDVLDLSRVEQGKMEVFATNFHMDVLLNYLETSANGLIQTNSNRFELIQEGPLPKVFFGDEMKIRQVLLNLIGNAAKFTANGVIRLRVAVQQGKLRFAIEDTGRGIKQRDIERLFDTFERVEQGFDSSEGSGLGLALSKSFAQLLGGDLWCESVWGEGSTFYFDVPPWPEM